MTKKNSGVAQVILVVILAVIIVVAILLSIPKGPKPPIEVRCSLASSTINENEFSVLTVSIKNLDLKTHKITLVFDASSRISIYAGTERLLQQNMYTLTLDATDPSQQKVFTVSGSLDQKVSSAQYPLVLKVYVDGNELKKNWDDLLLTVKR